MASPTEAELWTQLTNAVDLLEELRKYGHVNSENFLAHEDTLVQSLEGDYVDQILSGLASIRAGIASSSSGRAAASLLTGILRQFAKLNSWPETDVDSLIDRMWDYMISDSESVQTRDFTFGSPTKDSGTGNGLIHRLSADEENLDIESQHVEAKRAECISDANSGAREHEELFEFRGAAAERDEIKMSGSGEAAKKNIAAISAADSQSWINNPSFSRYVLNGSVIQSLAGWTVGSSWSNFGIDTGVTYREYPGSPGVAALKVTADDYILQELRRRVDPRVPLYLQVAWNREEGAANSGAQVKLHIGSTVESFTIGSETGWQILMIPIGQKNWFKTWNQQDLAVKLEVSGLTSGYILFDDLIVAPFSEFDGGWYAVVGGDTPFLKDCLFTWSDSETGAKIQFHFFKAFGRYLPHSATPSRADP